MAHFVHIDKPNANCPGTLLHTTASNEKFYGVLMRFILFCVFSLFYTGIICTAQTITPEKLGFSPGHIVDPVLGEINYYTTGKDSKQSKPILLYLDGSGPYPLFQYTAHGIGSSVVLNFRKLSEHYQIVLISKPGVPFIDSVRFSEETGMPEYAPPDIYKKYLSLQWRVNAADKVIDALTGHASTVPQVVVMGISEGFQVGAKLATVNKKISYAILLEGNGLPQFYDFYILNRLDALNGKITAEQAQENIDSLNSRVRDIMAHPTAVDREWMGHTYLRWASFCSNQPVENLLSLSFPVYIVGSANDRNSPLINFDFIQLQAALHQKDNITVRVYPYDHAFNEAVLDEKGTVVGAKNHTQEVIDSALAWLDSELKHSLK